MQQGSSPVMPRNGGNWFFDNGATSHVTNGLSNLSVQNPYTGGNGNTLLVVHSGKGLLPTPSTSFFLSNILHVPSISHNLVSVY